MAKINELQLKREKNKFNGKDYFNYFIPCECLGHSEKARMIPKDNGGYIILDHLFDVVGEKSVSVIRKVSKQTDNGSTRQVITYTVRYNTSEDEEPVEIDIKCNRPSDEARIRNSDEVRKKKPVEVDEETGEIITGDGIEVDE